MLIVVLIRGGWERYVVREVVLDVEVPGMDYAPREINLQTTATRRFLPFLKLSLLDGKMDSRLRSAIVSQPQVSTLTSYITFF